MITLTTSGPVPSLDILRGILRRTGGPILLVWFVVFATWQRFAWDTLPTMTGPTGRDYLMAGLCVLGVAYGLAFASRLYALTSPYQGAAALRWWSRFLGYVARAVLSFNRWCHRAAARVSRAGVLLCALDLPGAAPPAHTGRIQPPPPSSPVPILTGSLDRNAPPALPCAGMRREASGPRALTIHDGSTVT